MKLIEKEINLITGEEIVTERDETAAEFAIRQANAATHAKHTALRAEADAAKVIANAKLSALGLTADDLKALGL